MTSLSATRWRITSWVVRGHAWQLVCALNAVHGLVGLVARVGDRGRSGLRALSTYAEVAMARG